MDKDTGYKVTEFNSNLATLIRIDSLMKQIHNVHIGIIPPHKVQGFHYISLLDRLFMEVYPKLSKDELEECLKRQKEINRKLKEYSMYLSNQEIAQYKISWSIINGLSRSYEMYLILCLDYHGMLTSEKGTGIQRFRGMM